MYIQYMFLNERCLVYYTASVTIASLDPFLFLCSVRTVATDRGWSYPTHLVQECRPFSSLCPATSVASLLGKVNTVWPVLEGDID